MLLKKALEIDPHYGLALIIMADLLRLAAHSEDAAVFYKLALTVEPRQPWILKGLAMAYYDSGKKDEAFSCIERAQNLELELEVVEINPLYNDQKFRMQLGISLRGSGQYHKAF